MHTAIVWFRRDLRLSDNPAWRHACMGANRVLPVYVHAPEEEGGWAPGAASRWWLHHGLESLAREISRKGSRLLVLRGPTREALQRLANACGADALLWNRLYEPDIVARDRDVEGRFRGAGLQAESFNAALLCEPWTVANQAGDPYRVFTPFWRACRERAAAEIPERAPARVPPLPGDVPAGVTLDELGLLPTVAWDGGLRDAWSPGEAGAARALRRFCGSRLNDYPRERERPSEAGTSRLSAHLHFGEIGPRQVVAAVHRQAGAGTDKFLAELGWREFAHHLLFHFPDTPDHSLDPRFRQFPWARDTKGPIEAWRAGRTGIPMVDAGMRELWTTGWMHNRVRMLVASMLTKNLLVPWQEGAGWFWDTLVDADLANNTLGWQWVAGCGADAAPYFRIFNPVIQGRRYDPDGEYVRRWIPELAGVPDRFVHAPWESPTPPSDYPPPIVDLKESRARALAAFRRMKERR